ncbi:M23 family metallopeptidase [Marispirochaeta sp.]|jgi:hypothetical protein|uniref:M23 family metallopeptidase n=1 Tax=Marispirochaeta sp. TaxID=2038653 RepID=UPI0029C72A97|nr:M23 family metallopeptidase [Marispirochaeta sp.]
MGVHRIISAIILIAVFPGLLFALEYQWPVKKVLLTGTFAEDRGDHFHSGIDLGGGEQDIYPVSSGEVVYFFEESTPASVIPSGMGNFIVAEHAGGVRSLYAHLQEDSLDIRDSRLDPSVPLGIMGESGSSLGVHLHLSIIDSDTDNIVNPLLILPPQIDTTRPSIGGVFLARGKGTVDLDTWNRPILAGRWDLRLELYDQSEHSYYWPMAPFRVTVYMNGSETVYMTYEFISYKEGTHYLVDTPGLSHESMYISETRISLGEINLNPGETRVEIVVADYFGNETIFQKAVTVK